MKELAVISGKGGTGKTSIVASLAALAENAVLADCDVDAADLHLVLAPTVKRCAPFSGGSQAHVNTELCAACGKCEEVCRFGAVALVGSGNGGVEQTFQVDPIACEGCGVCAWFCPTGAMAFGPVVNGEWMSSDTRCGPMVHACLGVAQENSGKLVSLVRSEAKKIAAEQNFDYVIIDGSPGIGCPVIASITGADLALIVTEPTLSGLHDLERVVKLTEHFKIPAVVCINKFDLNLQVTNQIQRFCSESKLAVVGQLPYDRSVTQAQLVALSVVEYGDSPIAKEIHRMWSELKKAINQGAEDEK